MDILQCEVNGNCRQPVELKLNGRYICGVHWKRHCEETDRRHERLALEAHADDPFHLDHLNQFYGVSR